MRDVLKVVRRRITYGNAYVLMHRIGTTATGDEIVRCSTPLPQEPSTTMPVEAREKVIEDREE